MEEAKPVVLTKPVRGREMLSKKGPLERAGGAAEPEKVEKKKVETYYEGYVDGQLFLVPDSNLEAMKDMINFKMRPKTSIRYKHQTSYDIQYYDQFTEKLNELLSKIDDFQESGDFERIKSDDRDSSEESFEDKDKEETEPVEKMEDKKHSEEETGNKEVTKSKEYIGSVSEKSKETIGNVSEKSKEKKGSESEKSKEKIGSGEKSNESVKSKIDQVKSEIVEELKKEYVLEDTSLCSSSTSSSSSQTSKLSEKLDKPEKEIASQMYEGTQNETSTDELRIRFLISGHFKDGENPVYIVQEYDGKTDIFKDQKIDFTSFQEKSNANIFISGKLYTENILVESEGNPLFLNTKPEKIIIDEEKSKMFSDSFEQVFEKEDYCISLQGNFIKGKNDQITPSLSLCVKEKSTSSNSGNDKEERPQKQ